MPCGIIFDVKELETHDGPGVRTTVFLKGCPLRCAWCHNPEGISFSPELVTSSSLCTKCGLCRRPCGHEECRPFGRCLRVCPAGAVNVAGRGVDVEELADRLLHQADVLAACGGGITLSGGEPLAQPDFAVALIGLLHPLHVAVQTSAYVANAVFRGVAETADLMMVDIKCMDSARHARLTGVDNAAILENISWLMRSGRRFVARLPLIPGLNDSAADMQEAARFLAPARETVSVELLPYNPFAGAKYPLVGKPWNPPFDETVPAERHPAIFRDQGLECRVL